jgi:hypothetical protein
MGQRSQTSTGKRMSLRPTRQRRCYSRYIEKPNIGRDLRIRHLARRLCDLDQGPPFPGAVMSTLQTEAAGEALERAHGNVPLLQPHPHDHPGTE